MPPATAISACPEGMSPASRAHALSLDQACLAPYGARRQLFIAAPGCCDCCPPLLKMVGALVLSDAGGGRRDVGLSSPTPPATRLGWLVCTTTACDGCLLLAGFRLLLRRGRATVHTHCAHPQPAQFVTCPWLGRRDWAGLALPAPLDGRTHSARLFVACPFLVGLPPSFGGEGPAQACAAAQIFGQG